MLNFKTRSRRPHTEHINELVLRRDIVNEGCLLVGNDEVTVNFNVLDALMKNIIMSNMNNTDYHSEQECKWIRSTCWSKTNKAREAQR